MQRPDSRVLPFRRSLRPAVVFLSCPVRASLDVLGKKWSMLLLYSLGFMKLNRFNQIRKYVPEISPSLLARRLSELENAGYVERQSQGGSPPRVTWELTQKGKDTVPIIARLIAHSSKWRAEELFEDKAPKTLDDIFPLRSGRQLLEIAV